MAKTFKTAEEAKAAGNVAFGEQRFEEALTCYGAALALQPSAAVLTNRSMVLFTLKRHAESLVDAEKAIELDPKWLKGYFRRYEALQALSRRLEALAALQTCVELEPANEQLKGTLVKAQQTYVAEFFGPLTSGLPVQVKYTDLLRGRGVFATKKFHQGEIVYQEAPLACHRVPDPVKDKIQCCDYSLRSVLDPKGLPQPFQKPLEDYYTKGTTLKFVPCPDCKDDPVCGEHYASEEIRMKARSEYHQILCVGSKGESHPVRRLTAKAKELRKTNPLFIMRMMATIVQRARDLRAKHPAMPASQIAALAQEPYAMFISNEEQGPLDQETVDTLREVCGPAAEFTDLVTLSLYRRLNGAILRNAQALSPTSDLHQLLNSLPTEEQFKLVRSYVPSFPSPLEFLTTRFMMGLCIEGSGLFLLANSTNHSCEPNIVSTSSTNDNRVTMVACREIRKGEELFISYIDESMPFQQRQEKLKAMYLFDCTCPKCQRKQ